MGDAPRGARMDPGNTGDHAKLGNSCTVGDAPRGARMDPVNTGDRTKIDNRSAVKDAPRAPRGAQAGDTPGTDVTRENNGGEVEDTTIYSSDEVPDEITMEWWQK